MILLSILGAYLAGSVPFGKLLGMQQGIDIQAHGSGNIGFANSVRVLGWKMGILVLIGDLTKGYLPTLLALIAYGKSIAIVVGCATIIGHVFPVWLRFRGGKGIATGLGMTAALSVPLAVCAIAVYCTAFALWKRSAPASLLSAWLLPVGCAALSLGSNFVGLYALLALFVTWTHRTNIQTLLGRVEHAYD